jgi:hypothetical protein
MLKSAFLFFFIISTGSFSFSIKSAKQNSNLNSINFKEKKVPIIKKLIKTKYCFEIKDEKSDNEEVFYEILSALAFIQVMLIIFKLIGVFAISWFFVLIPLWIFAAMAIIVFIALMCAF